MIGKDFTAYVLAGGSSRRMGTDKLFFHIDGQSLLERTLASCAVCFTQVKIVAGETARFASLDYPVLLDSPRARGPMAGVIAALEDCDADACYVTAADLLDLNEDVITSLLTRYHGQQYLGLMETNGIQPLCGLYHRSSLETLVRCAQTGDFSVSEAVKKLDHSGIVVPTDRWRNLNHPADLALEDRNG